MTHLLVVRVLETRPEEHEVFVGRGLGWHCGDGKNVSVRGVRVPRLVICGWLMEDLWTGCSLL